MATTIGECAVQAIKERARQTGRKPREEFLSLEITDAMWHNWKHGIHNPNVYFLKNMALAGYDVVYILTGKEPK